MGAGTSSGSAALVTGAEGPVGSAVVERLRAEGFAVAGVGDERGAGDLPLAADTTDRDQMIAAAERAASELGTLSILVTAPYRHDAAPFGEMSTERWNRLLSAHLGGTVNACAAVVPGMIAAGRGTVVTTSSWLALAGIAGESYEAAATGAILAFTKSFSLEVASHGVRVNCVAVGPLEGQREPHIAPADVAETVMFLIRDGDFFVGQVFSPAAGAVV